MKHIKTLGLALLALFAFSAIAATAASAVEGPFYKVNGKTLKAGETRLLLVLNAPGTEFSLGGNTGPKVKCKHLTLPSPANMQIEGVAAGNGGMSQETLLFSKCTLAEKSNGEGCTTVTEPIETGVILNTLGYSTATRTGPILVVFEPLGANGANNKVFVTLKFPGETCAVKTAAALGAVIGEATEGGKIISVGNNKEALHGDVVFLENGPKTIFLEKGGAVSERKTELEFGGVKAKFGGTALILVDEGGVPVPWGVFN